MTRIRRRAYQTLISPAKSVALLVEDCLTLSIREAVGDSPLYERTARKILLFWPRGRFEMSINGEVDLWDPAKAFVRLHYEIEGVPVDQRVELTSTKLPFRWWFVCPLRRNPVAKLYIPPGARRFAGRTAHGLIYKCQLRPKRHMSLPPNVVRSLRRLRGQKPM